MLEYDIGGMIKGFTNTTLAMLCAVILAGVISYLVFSQKDDRSPNNELFGEYEWEDADLKTRYSDAEWNKIVIGYLAGFAPSAVIEKRTTNECGNWQGGNYLRVEGGMCPVGYWLEDAAGKKFDTLEKLVRRFAPVENEPKAISFVTVTEGDLQIAPTGIPAGHSLAMSDGYLVQLVRKNMYGCRSHEPTGVIFKITERGEIREVAHEKEKPASSPILCVD